MSVNHLKKNSMPYFSYFVLLEGKYQTTLCLPNIFKTSNVKILTFKLNYDLTMLYIFVGFFNFVI